jgi:four helix bundle protein
VGKWEKDIYERALEFAARVESACDALAARRRASANSLRQLGKSSSAIGSNLQEAKGAQSRADFHSKVHVALKEARETHYWLRLIAKRAAKPELFTAIVQEANEIVAVLTTIAKNTDPRHKPTS